MRRAPNPYRVLAHAIEVGDDALCALLIARLSRAAPGPRAVVARLVRALDLD